MERGGSLVFSCFRFFVFSCFRFFVKPFSGKDYPGPSEKQLYENTTLQIHQLTIPEIFAYPDKKQYACIIFKRRAMTLEEYFDSLTQKVKPEDLEGIDTQINFDLKGRNMYVTVKDGKIETGEGLVEGAEVNITVKEEDLLSIIGGQTNPMMAMMMGKLKISNPGAMLKYAKILGLM